MVTDACYAWLAIMHACGPLGQSTPGSGCVGLNTKLVGTLLVGVVSFSVSVSVSEEVY